MSNLAVNVQQAVGSLKTDVDGLKAYGSGGGGAGGERRPFGVVDWKNMIPGVFDGKKEDFDNWAEDVWDYLETVVAGTAKLLEAVGMADDDGSVTLVRGMREAIDVDVEKTAPMLYTLLKRYITK